MRWVINVSRKWSGGGEEESYYVKAFRDLEESVKSKGASMCVPYTIAHCNYGVGHLTVGDGSITLVIV